MSFRLLLLVLLPAVFAEDISRTGRWDGPGSRIGKYVNITKYPYIVSIRLANSGRVVCTGIIIAPSWVLSVPYCFMLTPEHYQQEWDHEGTIPPFAEIMANKLKPKLISRFSMRSEVLPEDSLRAMKFGPHDYNKSLETSTTEGTLSKEQIEKTSVPLDPDIFEVLAGTSFASECDSGGQLRQVTNIVIHPSLKLPLRKQRNPRHELALVKVKMPFVNMNSITYAPLLRNFTLEKHTSKNCQLVGWGRGKTKKPFPGLRRSLSEIEVSLYDSRSCRYIENTYLRAIWDDDPEPWFCSYDKKHHATPICQSDSGGPLVCGGRVVALLSWVRTPNCYYKNTEFARFRPVYYSRIYPDLQWITGVLGRSSSKMVVFEEDMVSGAGQFAALHSLVLLSAVVLTSR